MHLASIAKSSLHIALASFVLVTGAAAAQSATPVLTSKPTPAAAPALDPHANPAAIVTFGHARFTVLTPQLIRMEWSADDRFEDRASLVFLNRRLSVPQFTHSQQGDTLTLETSALRLVYRNDAAAGKFTAANLHITLKLDGRDVEWHPGLEDKGNLQGTTRTLDGARGDKTKEPIDPGLVSRDGWTVVDDSTRNLFDSTDFHFTQGEKSPWPWVVARPAGERQDLYFFGYGHDYRQALGDYVRVAGRIPLPPRFAFGAWWSRYWAYSDQELDDLVRGFQQNNTPLDVLVIDMDWHLNERQLKAMGQTDQAGERLGWTGYTWNPELFPDPQAFLAHLHDEGLKATLNLHPASGVQPFEKPYPEMARAMGIDPATRKYVPFDITDKKYATNYMDLLHHPLEKQGIDFWWLDWQQEPTTKIAGLSPTWWLNYVHFTDQEREGKRPLLFHRWGGLGNHRYQIGFSGDTVSVWESLAFQPWFTATAANVGYAYWSHDIGGHMPGVVDPELYTRWVQFGAYSPILRTHTTKNAFAERRIWTYPEPYAGIMRDTFQQRYALEPYLYTEARRTYDTGVAFLHPLYYDWPEADAAYTNKSEYVFGSQMIAAPVVAPADPTTQLARESVWIPQGEWIEAPTGRHLTGPAQLERSFSIEQVPLYVRSGAIIPMQPPMQYTGQKPVDPLILTIYPLADRQSSSYTLYDDNGHAEDYQRGVCSWTMLHAEQHGDDLIVTIDPVKGSFPGMQSTRAYELRLPADWPPDTVTVGAQKLAFTGRDEGKPGWRFEGNTLTTIVLTPRASVHQSVRIVLHRAAGSLASRQQLDGFAGSVTRLRSAYAVLNQLHPLAAPPDAVIHAAQIGDRLTYQPATARAELAAFPAQYTAAAAATQKLHTSLKAAQKGKDEVASRIEPAFARVEASLTDGQPK